MLNNLKKGDKVTLASGVQLEIATVRVDSSKELPVRIIFNGYSAESGYATTGKALPRRGNSPHDILHVEAAPSTFDVAAARFGDLVKVAGVTHLFLQSLDGGKVSLGMGDSLATMRGAKVVDASVVEANN